MLKVPPTISGYHLSFGQDTAWSWHLIRFLQCLTSFHVLAYSGSQDGLQVQLLLQQESSGTKRPSESDRRMPLIGNGIKSKTAGKSGLNNRIYQLFYDCLKKHAETDNEKVGFFHRLS